MDTRNMKTDLFAGCFIRGLPIGTPFKTKIEIPATKSNEFDTDEGVFIITTVRNEQESEMNPVLPDIAEIVELVKVETSMEEEDHIGSESQLQLEMHNRNKGTQIEDTEHETFDSVDADQNEEAGTAGNSLLVLNVRLNEVSHANGRMDACVPFCKENAEEDFVGENKVENVRRSARIKSGFVSKYGRIKNDDFGTNSNSNNGYDDAVVKENEVNDEFVKNKESVKDSIYLTWEDTLYHSEDEDIENIRVDDNENVTGKKKKKKKEDNDPDFDPWFDSHLPDNVENEVYDTKDQKPSSETLEERVKVEIPDAAEAGMSSGQNDSSSDSDMISDFDNKPKDRRRRKRKLPNNFLSDISDEDIDSESESRAQKKKLAIKAKEQRQKEKLMKETQRIKVKLKDHPDKYRFEVLESFARKDRGKAPEDCAIEIMVCTICEKFKAKHDEAMEIHIENHLNGELNCSECAFIASYLGELKQHRRAVHRHNVHMCSECGEELHGHEGLMNHLGRVHDKPQWKCNYCIKERNVYFACKTKALYRAHVRSEHPERLLSCKKCNKLFASEYQLQRHMDTNCSGNEPKGYPCEKCGKTYVGVGRLKAHIDRVHSHVRHYQCPHCPFAACRKAALSQHLHVHSGYHPVKCDLCPFTCVQKYQLTSHMRTHTGDKPYKCSQCKFAAAWKVQLKEHQKIHNMPSSVNCDKCDILFRDIRAYRTHVNKEHAADPK